MNIKEMRSKLGITQNEFATRYGIPFRTIQNWESGERKPAEYIVKLLESKVNSDLANRKSVSLPKYDSKKRNLPKRTNYISSISWLKDVQKLLGTNCVFALDNALMCQDYFLGHNDEYAVFVYGDNSLTEYNGVIILGNYINPSNIEYREELRYTNLNRTIYDSLVNESILDMQGITEAINKYYYSNEDSLDGLFIPPEYQERFDELAKEAIKYFENY